MAEAVKRFSFDVPPPIEIDLRQHLVALLQHVASKKFFASGVALS